VAKDQNILIWRWFSGLWSRHASSSVLSALGCEHFGIRGDLLNRGREELKCREPPQMHGHPERLFLSCRQSVLAYVSIFAWATSYLHRQQREAVVSSRDLRPDDRARSPAQRPVAPIRCRRMVQAIAPRGRRSGPVVAPETLLRRAKATACTARRTSLTTKHADENRHHDRTRTRSFHSCHAPRPIEEQTIHVAPPE
jgi:hypothetical protein